MSRTSAFFLRSSRRSKSFFAGAERDLDLDEGVLEIHSQRDQRATAGVERLGDLPNLMAVQEQFAGCASRRDY